MRTGPCGPNPAKDLPLADWIQSPRIPRTTMKRSTSVLSTCLALCLSPLAQAQDPVWNLDVIPGNHAWILAAAPLASGSTVALRMTPWSTKPPLFDVIGADGQVAQTFGPGAGLWGPTFRGTTDGLGGAYIMGTEYTGAVGSPPNGGGDAVIFHLDASGQLISTRRVGGSGQDVGHAILEDGSGGYYLAGQTDSPDFGTPSTSPADGFLTHVDLAGNISWVTRLNSGTDFGVLTALAHDGQGGLLVGGSFDDHSGIVVVPRGFASGFNTLGVQQWIHHNHASGGSVAAIEPTASGYVELAHDFIAGYQCTGRDGTGQALWSVSLGAVGGLYDTPNAMIRRPNGTFLLGGHTTASGNLAHIRAFDGNGTVLWDREYPHAIGRTNSVYTMALDGNGDLYVGGNLGGTPSIGLIGGYVSRIALETQGQMGCAGQPNSTGSAAVTEAIGSLGRSDNDLTLFTRDLPTHVFGFYIGAQASGYVPNPGGSQGDLCLGGAIGRFNRTHEILHSGQEGLFHLYLDLGDVPTPTGPISTMAGQTWHFQSWYRAAAPSSSSNFSSSTFLTLQ